MKGIDKFVVNRSNRATCFHIAFDEVPVIHQANAIYARNINELNS